MKYLLAHEKSLNEFHFYKDEYGVHIVINRVDKIIANAPGNLSRFYYELRNAVAKVRVHKHSVGNSAPVNVFITNRGADVKPCDFKLCMTMKRETSSRDEILVLVGFIPVGEHPHAEDKVFTGVYKEYSELMGYVKLIKDLIDENYNYKKGCNTNGSEERKNGK
jgi:hypothetical protein